MIEFEIDLGPVKYPVIISGNLINNLKVHITRLKPKGSIVVLIDEMVANLYKDSMKELGRDKRFFVYRISAGKNNKSFYSALKIFEYLDVNNISRDSTIVAIGGGVVGDMGGFIASCWYRGVSLIHIPTTLLAAVDSCVGGKTAINFRSTVNAVGTYHHPDAILIDIETLKSLPQREISSGFGEIIKYACIGANHIRDILNVEDFNNISQIDILIQCSLKEKERFVSNDVSEKSNRLFLNFGHTIGHAIEFSTVFDGEETLRHGEGVALGMLSIFRICEKLGYLKEAHVEILKNLLTKFKLPIQFESEKFKIKRAYLVERIVDLCFKDKKRIMNDLRLILVDSNYQPFVYKTNDRNLIECGVLEVIK